LVDPRLESTTAEKKSVNGLHGLILTWSQQPQKKFNRNVAGRSAAKSQSGGGVVHGNVAIGVCPTSLVLRYVGIDEIENHVGHIVIESLGDTLLGAG